MSESKYERYLKTYAGSSLLEKYSLDQEGMWQIKGEDPNCDFGGHHYQPDLGLVTGKLQDVIEYAVELNSFWTWGAGGDIVPRSSPLKISPDANKRRRELQQKLREAEALVASLTEQLKEV